MEKLSGYELCCMAEGVFQGCAYELKGAAARSLNTSDITAEEFRLRAEDIITTLQTLVRRIEENT